MGRQGSEEDAIPNFVASQDSLTQLQPIYCSQCSCLELQKTASFILPALLIISEGKTPINVSTTATN